MKTKYLIAGIFLAVVTLVHGVTNDLNAALQRGLFEEEGNRDYNAAISVYQSLAAQFDQSRQVAATAIFRLGECYRKLGRTNEAVAQYDRIVREFSDQQTLVTLSRQNLAGLGTRPEAAAAASAALSQTAQLERKQLLQQEIMLAEQDLEIVRSKIKLGQASTAEAIPKEREVLQLRRQLAELDVVPEKLAPSVTTAVDDEEKEIRRIQGVIQNSPDLINAANGEEGTPLFQAASKGQLRVAGYLLDHGADVNTRAGIPGKIMTDWTPLIAAANQGHKAMVELLAARGANINATVRIFSGATGGNVSGGTALHQAVEKGFQGVAESLLANKADINARNTDGRTPLLLAAYNGYPALITFLLSKGADVNAQNQDGLTPLGYAAFSGKLESVHTLLAAGAKPDISDNQVITPLGVAARNGGSLEIVKALLDAKADPNGGERNPPLFYAIKQGNTNLAALLIHAGADVNRARTLDGQMTSDSPRRRPSPEQIFTNTPLAFAVVQNQAAMVEMLLKFKADPNGDDGSGEPLIFKGLFHPDIMKTLLEAGADPNSIETRTNGIAGHGETPLLLVARVRFQPSPDGKSYSVINEGDLGAARLLIAHGANANARRPSDGGTVLHVAVGSGNRELVELILANKVDVNARNNAGETPLDLVNKATPAQPAERAVAFGAIAPLLRQHGALDNLPDFSSIRVTRAGGGQPFVVFQKDTNSVNRFTLLEVIRNFYRNAIDNREKPFPDFSKIIIQRPVAGKVGARKEITVNLLTETNSFDCAKDQWLEFGDVIEIPEREHTLAEQAIGITEEQSRELSRCLEGKVTFVVRGQKTELKLDGSAYTGWLQLALTGVQNLLRSSSDLSHIKIRRTDPATKAAKEIIADSKAKQSDNVWLRDGDVIEVPDK